MGCTSSAQNMSPSLSNSASEKDFKLSEKTDEKVAEEMTEIAKKGNESNGIQVLPTCDTLGESTHLDRNKSLVDMMNPGLEKGPQENEHNMKNEEESRSTDENTTNVLNIESNTNGSHIDEKLSTLEEVVDKVVELFVEGSLESKPEEAKDENSHTKLEDGHNENKNNENQEDQKETKAEEEEEAPEAASPSQSQSSRATRWEALADIAAELPPSLAVDPITGQIYSLSK